MTTRRKQFVALALFSVSGALTAGLLDHESTGFLSLFSEPGNIAGLLVWAALFFTVGSVLFVLWTVARATFTQLAR